MQISLSLWSLDQGHLADEVARYGPLVESFHVDVSDGWFTDNLLFGPLAVETLRRFTRSEIVTHLMVTEPSRWTTRFIDAGADLIVFHPTACSDIASTITGIQRAGGAAGMAIGRSEPCEPVLEILGDLSLVLVMGTATGVKGQPFDEGALDVAQTIIEARPADGPAIFIDGGIRWTSLSMIRECGADGIVAGSILAEASDPRAAVAAIAAA
jgi:ribulose-phosphate 3-epimerase